MFLGMENKETSEIRKKKLSYSQTYYLLMTNKEIIFTVLDTLVECHSKKNK